MLLTARLSVYKMFVFLEVVAHLQLRYVVGEYLAPPVEQVHILVGVSILLIQIFGRNVVANIVAGKFHHRLVVVGGYVVNLSLLDVVVHFFGVVLCFVTLYERNLTRKHIYTGAEKQLQLAEIFLKVMAAKSDDIQVLHWDNREWGETPADFGNK